MTMFTVLLALVGTADATTVFVPTQQPTIGDALNSLTGTGPHTIEVIVDGTYTETVTVDIAGRDIEIVGTGPATVLQLQSGSVDPLFSVDGGRLVLRDVTVSGCGIDDLPSGFSGVAAENGTVEAYNSTFECLVATSVGLTLNPYSGGAIASVDSDVVVMDSEFRANGSIDNGGHIAALGNTLAPPTVTLLGNDFKFGSASTGGAIYLSNVEAVVENNDFYANFAAAKGGGLYLATISPTSQLYQNAFRQNVSLSIVDLAVGGASDTGAPASAALEYFLFDGYGGGLYLDADNADVWANTFCGNVAISGAGMNSQDPTGLTVQNNIFADNWAYFYAGGLFVVTDTVGQPSPSVWNNTFIGNSAGQSLDKELYVYGGGAAAMFDGTVADFRSNIVAFSLEGAGVTGVDGASYTIGDPLIMEHNLWYSNSEGYASVSTSLAGDYASHTLNQTNVIEVDPFPTFQGLEELDCYPDAFYPEWGSAAVNAGPNDAVWDDVDGTTNDIGFTGGPRAPVEDRDGDGYMNTLDCDDTDAMVNPQANEVCDFVDNDCDGEVDEGTPNSWYLDEDGDGWGTDDNTVTGWKIIDCTNPDPLRYVDQTGDCDDSDPAVSPDATEICDEIDNNCSGTVDDEEIVPDYQSYADSDGDGYGDPGTVVTDCLTPDGYVLDAGDCDDNNASVNPAAPELCDGIDNDCFGGVDNDAQDELEWYQDLDGDTFGGGDPVYSCNAPGDGTFVNIGGDCNEADVEINPAADEVCDTVDNNCDGEVDNDPVDGTSYYADLDGDGYVDPDSEVRSCNPVDGLIEPSSTLIDPFDCDDEDDLTLACPSECGCQMTSGPSQVGWLALLAGVVLGIRRRRD